MQDNQKIKELQDKIRQLTEENAQLQQKLFRHNTWPYPQVPHESDQYRWNYKNDRA